MTLSVLGVLQQKSIRCRGLRRRFYAKPFVPVGLIELLSVVVLNNSDGDRKVGNADRCQACSVNETVFLHLCSSLLRCAPELLVYCELLRTKRRYIHGATKVEAEWMVEYAPLMCTFSSSHAVATYDSETDEVYRHLDEQLLVTELFKPGYTAPPPLFHYGGIPMNFRGNWEISRRDLQNLYFIAMDSSNDTFFDSDGDEYSVPTSRSVLCCRIIAMIFVVLVVLRHTLPFIVYGAGEYSISVFMLLTLRTIGVFLPIYIMIKALSAVQRRRNRQDPPIFPISTSDAENDIAIQPPQAHVVQVP